MKSITPFNGIFLAIIFCSLMFNSCNSQSHSKEDSISFGTGKFSIQNDSYILYDDPKRPSRSTYIKIEGEITIEPTEESLKALDNTTRFARLQVHSINGKKFNVHDKNFNVHPNGSVELTADGRTTFDIRIRKTHVEHSELKELPAKMRIEGFYSYYGDNSGFKEPFTIEAEMSSDHMNIYSRFMTGAIEEELGLAIDKSTVKGLILNQYQLSDLGLTMDLSEFTSVENLFIRGMVIDDPFPEEIFKLRKLQKITFDVTNINPDGSWKQAADCKLYLPKEVFDFPDIKSLTFNHTVALNIPDFPEGCPLERFEVFSHCQIDSVPASIINLKHLSNLSFHIGIIHMPLPDNMDKLTQLDTIHIKLPDAHIPEAFGPWKNLQYASIKQTNMSNMNLEEFRQKAEENRSKLIEIFSNARVAIIDHRKYEFGVEVR